jgi:K+-transporting ATPase ATPase C chain
MKQNIFPAIKLTLFCMLFFMGFYSLIILAMAQLAPANGRGEQVMVNNKVVGFKLLGQKFTHDKYFQGRPSAVDYNAAGSAGSNKGPSNPAYLKIVEDRVGSFLEHNPGIKKEEIPSDLVTASGSGLDPDISVQGAFVQVQRIASVRKIRIDEVRSLVTKHIEKPLAGLFGTEKVNVLQLNIALDKIENFK